MGSYKVLCIVLLLVVVVVLSIGVAVDATTSGIKVIVVPLRELYVSNGTTIVNGITHNLAIVYLPSNEVWLYNNSIPVIGRILPNGTVECIKTEIWINGTKYDAFEIDLREYRLFLIYSPYGSTPFLQSILAISSDNKTYFGRVIGVMPPISNIVAHIDIVNESLVVHLFTANAALFNGSSIIGFRTGSTSPILSCRINVTNIVMYDTIYNAMNSITVVGNYGLSDIEIGIIGDRYSIEALVVIPNASSIATLSLPQIQVFAKNLELTLLNLLARLNESLPTPNPIVVVDRYVYNPDKYVYSYALTPCIANITIGNESVIAVEPIASKVLTVTIPISLESVSTTFTSTATTSPRSNTTTLGTPSQTSTLSTPSAVLTIGIPLSLLAILVTMAFAPHRRSSISIY